MYRQIIIPDSKSYLLNLPANFIGRQVEIIAFPVEDKKKADDKYSVEKALKFFKKYAIDFGRVVKWKREDLYE
ncbi:MAG: hypothetical protein COS14_08290 [Bacteroidetes bacterium CG02_land_8_20_14_3_00_31_25]|nr:hypothetical protein [Bacteroidota bacterium]PIV58688.1 MAG: hypothetical protein COS14_08290 [Bacteroidetes bacterium CG02_land_8_20_14_3_00_31_25]PIX32530.1 MAG: hypothetical protein COZ59_13500 [Bacteroidetes bacterium CG_4_8_14_3_um_filter_31_14]PIY03480.1 MAG: hypothetical protein COZ21_09130 [Bacteroidetes bacterium CG_4_10_14_3_um_filter_31_20]